MCVYIYTYIYIYILSLPFFLLPFFLAAESDWLDFSDFADELLQYYTLS